MSYFWSRVTFDDFLIQGLNITSSQGFATVVLAVMALAVLSEGIRTSRDLLMDRFIRLKRRNLLLAGTGTFEVKYTNPNTTIILNAKNLQNKANVANKEHSHNMELASHNVNSMSCKTANTEDVDVDGVISSAKRWSNCLILLGATTLHMTYICTGYTLMLCVMTFNIWILCGVTVGSGCGYFIFYHIQQKIRPLNDIKRS